MRLSATDDPSGAAVLLVVLVVMFMLAGGLSLPVPQGLPGAIAAAIGVAIWFAVLRRRRA